jgi:hypothetical protein
MQRFSRAPEVACTNALGISFVFGAANRARAVLVLWRCSGQSVCPGSPRSEGLPHNKKMAALQQEWVASPSSINCIALGSSIIATGGQERRCCVWRLKDGEHLQSFAASTSSITCLDLDHDETHVLSGCEGGSARECMICEKARPREA